MHGLGKQLFLQSATYNNIYSNRKSDSQTRRSKRMHVLALSYFLYNISYTPTSVSIQKQDFNHYQLIQLCACFLQDNKLKTFYYTINACKVFKKVNYFKIQDYSTLHMSLVHICIPIYQESLQFQPDRMTDETNMAFDFHCTNLVPNVVYH